MIEYKYEKVEFNDLIEMLQAIKNDDIYLGSPQDRYSLLEYDGKSVSEAGFLDVSIETLLNGSLYELVETLHWERHVGGLVAVRNNDEGAWSFDVLEGRSVSELLPPWSCIGGRWREMRPLTKAEKDAIITKD